MDNEIKCAPLDPEQFARVWKRVMPDETSSPVVLNVQERPTTQSPACFPLGEEAMDSTSFLRERILLELCRWRSYQGLGIFTKQSSALGYLTRQTESRARRLAAALFLITGGWYLPLRDAAPQRWPNFRTALRSLFRSSQRDEASYRGAAEKTSDPLLNQLFLELAEESQLHQAQIRKLLENTPWRR